jgi:hypothetical protein
VADVTSRTCSQVFPAREYLKLHIWTLGGHVQAKRQNERNRITQALVHEMVMLRRHWQCSAISRADIDVLEPTQARDVCLKSSRTRNWSDTHCGLPLRQFGERLCLRAMVTKERRTLRCAVLSLANWSE